MKLEKWFPIAPAITAWKKALKSPGFLLLSGIADAIFFFSLGFLSPLANILTIEILNYAFTPETGTMKILYTAVLFIAAALLIYVVTQPISWWSCRRIIGRRQKLTDYSKRFIRITITPLIFLIILKILDISLALRELIIQKISPQPTFPWNMAIFILTALGAIWLWIRYAANKPAKIKVFKHWKEIGTYTLLTIVIWLVADFLLSFILTSGTAGLILGIVLFLLLIAFTRLYWTEGMNNVHS